MSCFYFIMFPFFCLRVLLFYSYNIFGLAVSTLLWHFLLAITEDFEFMCLRATTINLNSNIYNNLTFL